MEQVGAEGAVDAAALRPADVRRAGRRSRSGCDRGKSRAALSRFSELRTPPGNCPPTIWPPHATAAGSWHAGQLARRLGRRSCWSAGDRGRPSLRRLDWRRGCLLRSQDGARPVAAALSNRLSTEAGAGARRARLLRGGSQLRTAASSRPPIGSSASTSAPANDLGERAAADEHERRLLLGAAGHTARPRPRRLGSGAELPTARGRLSAYSLSDGSLALEHTDGPRRGQRRRHHRSCKRRSPYESRVRRAPARLTEPCLDGTGYRLAPRPRLPRRRDRLGAIRSTLPTGTASTSTAQPVILGRILVAASKDGFQAWDRIARRRLWHRRLTPALSKKGERRRPDERPRGRPRGHGRQAHLRPLKSMPLATAAWRRHSRPRRVVCFWRSGCRASPSPPPLSRATACSRRAPTGCFAG